MISLMQQHLSRILNFVLLLISPRVDFVVTDEAFWIGG